MLDYGAIGDGQADDTAAIQALIDAKAGSIRFPAGTYRITKPLVVDLDKVGFTSFVADGTARLVMAGPGPAIRFVGTHGRHRRARVGQAGGLGAAADADASKGWRSSASTPRPTASRPTGTMQLTLRGVHIRKCRHGVHLVERNRNVLIDALPHLREQRHRRLLRPRRICTSRTSRPATSATAAAAAWSSAAATSATSTSPAATSKPTWRQIGPPTANVLLDCTDGSVAEVAITGCTIQHTQGRSRARPTFASWAAAS